MTLGLRQGILPYTDANYLCYPIRHHITYLTLLHSERPKLYTILAFLSAIELKALIRILFQCLKFVAVNALHSGPVCSYYGLRRPLHNSSLWLKLILHKMPKVLLITPGSFPLRFITPGVPHSYHGNLTTDSWGLNINLRMRQSNILYFQAIKQYLFSFLESPNTVDFCYLKYWYHKVPFYIKEYRLDEFPIFLCISIPVISNY